MAQTEEVVLVEEDSVAETTMMKVEIPRELSNLLAELDTDGDGKLSAEELMGAVERLEAMKKKVKSQKKLIFGILGLTLIVCAVLLGVILLGNELSKETHAQDSRLTDTSGNTVMIDQRKEEVSDYTPDVRRRMMARRLEEGTTEASAPTVLSEMTDAELAQLSVVTIGPATYTIATITKVNGTVVLVTKKGMKITYELDGTMKVEEDLSGLHFDENADNSTTARRLSSYYRTSYGYYGPQYTYGSYIGDCGYQYQQYYYLVRWTEYTYPNYKWDYYRRCYTSGGVQYCYKQWYQKTDYDIKHSYVVSEYTYYNRYPKCSCKVLTDTSWRYQYKQTYRSNWYCSYY